MTTFGFLNVSEFCCFEKVNKNWSKYMGERMNSLRFGEVECFHCSQLKFLSGFVWQTSLNMTDVAIMKTLREDKMYISKRFRCVWQPPPVLNIIHASPSKFSFQFIPFSAAQREYHCLYQIIHTQNLRVSVCQSVNYLYKRTHNSNARFSVFMLWLFQLVECVCVY